MRRGDTGDLFHFFRAINGVEADTERIGAGDVAFLLDGVAIGNAVRGCTGGQNHLDFGNGGRVEARSELCEQGQNFGGRICLHGVVHAAFRQSAGQALEVLTHHFQINDNERLVGSGGAEKVVNSISHHIGGLPGPESCSCVKDDCPSAWWKCGAGSAFERGRVRVYRQQPSWVLNALPGLLPDWIWECPKSSRGQGRCASSVSPAFGRPTETKKALTVVAFGCWCSGCFQQLRARATYWATRDVRVLHGHFKRNAQKSFVIQPCIHCRASGAAREQQLHPVAAFLAALYGSSHGQRF